MDQCLGLSPGESKAWNDAFGDTLKEMCSRGVGVIPFLKAEDLGCD
jgi:hypothetical protein